MAEGLGGEFGTVDETVHLDADIDKDAEVYHVVHRSFDNGTWLDVRQFHDIFPGEGGRQIFPRIAAGFGQGGEDVAQCRFTGAQCGGEACCVGPGGFLLDGFQSIPVV